MSNPYEAPPLTSRPAAGRRVLAWCVDFALVLLAAYLLGVFTVHRITAMFTDGPELSDVWHMLRSDRDNLDDAGQLALSLWDNVATTVIQAFILLVACTFLYHWATLTLAGRTLGKMLLGLRITPQTSSRAARRAAMTTTADVACFSLACCLLISGAFVISVVVWCIAVAIFWTNVLPALSGSRRTLADRLAGTSVVRASPRAPSPATVWPR
ncbi:hypothetical protein SLUN_38345 (plasmid) [Streptomyces lunaelactis]|uniref:RDD domain-containing protein n=1 Tax=Streptomyces lunaelactis TaxID=1535768 RepID=A0A2R4TFK4_9ACTN|nr:RDD family protein [Streptomyces lunaelactis]AVZ77899.1 hypothetical protein SLUN_38345 [Streptomyces lunaelactis]NUK83441.1 RDD family protein [Streptomyces lunaelactis]NUL01726.1 RDD family protein [Streptomyces lunaelactis]